MGDLLARLQSALGAAYRVREELGGGGMGRVFVATETALDRPVVIKVLPPDLAPGLSVERFRREIQLAAKLQHPHIVPLLSAGAVQGLLYYTIPLIERSEEHTSELQSRPHLVCRLLLEKKKNNIIAQTSPKTQWGLTSVGQTGERAY